MFSRAFALLLTLGLATLYFVGTGGPVAWGLAAVAAGCAWGVWRTR